MTDKVITVIAAIVDKQKVVFYSDDGKTHTITQGDPRLPVLINKVMPIVTKGGKITISLDDYSVYEEFEKKTNSFVRFFRAAKEKVKSIVEAFIPETEDSSVEADTKAYLAQQTNKAVDPTEDLEDEIVSQVVVEAIESEMAIPEPPVEPQKPRYEDLKQDLKPVEVDKPVPEDETLVAVINGVVIPGIEQLKPYIQHALRHNSPESVIAFLERISQVIDKRGHSIPDLFKFLERGDLPLAKDGSIIAYKILRKSSVHKGFTYVDCHTNKVHQRVGTYVRVEESLVDKNRHNECSNGLHVARRGYIGQFSGDVCTMIKMAPEDVIAVPHRDANKVRVCGYHVIFELPDHVYNVLRSNRPMTSDPEAAAMLTKAIEGDHVGVLEEVWIGDQAGTNLSIKNSIDSNAEYHELKKNDIRQVQPKNEASAFDDPSKQGIDPKELNKKIKEEKAKVEPKTSILDSYNNIISNNDIIGAQELLDRKKKAKKSWTSFGLPDDAGTKLLAVVEAKAVTEPKDEETTKAFAKEALPLLEKAVKPLDKPSNPTTKDIARQMYENKDWVNLYAFKKAKKKAWHEWFNASEITVINSNKP